MKIGNTNSILFYPYKLGSRDTLNKLLQSSNLSQNLSNSKFFTVDSYCMRTLYPNKGNTIRYRFSECDECSSYKNYKELERIGVKEPLDIQTYPMVKLSGRIGEYIYLDTFTNLVIINQILSRKLNILNVPINAFVCGNLGYVYYNIQTKHKITASNIKLIVDQLSLYKITFVDFPEIKNNKITLRPNTAITIEKRRIIPYGYFICVGGLIEHHNTYFTIDLSDQYKIRRFKCIIMIGDMSVNVIDTINTITLFISGVNSGSVYFNKSVWRSFFVDDIEYFQFKNINFDTFLKVINGIKINYIHQKDKNDKERNL